MLCRTCLRVKRSIDSETEKKDRSLAALVGAARCHEVGIGAALVLSSNSRRLSLTL